MCQNELGQNFGVTDFLWNVEETSYTVRWRERQERRERKRREREKDIYIERVKGRATDRE